MNEKHHEMVLEKIHSSGVEEWYCPTCPRRFLVQWPPSYKIIILEPGDKDIRHNLSTGNRHIGSLELTQPDGLQPIEEFRLIPWMKWWQTVDFDPKWGNNVS